MPRMYTPRRATVQTRFCTLHGDVPKISEIDAPQLNQLATLLFHRCISLKFALPLRNIDHLSRTRHPSSRTRKHTTPPWTLPEALASPCTASSSSRCASCAAATSQTGKVCSARECHGESASERASGRAFVANQHAFRIHENHHRHRCRLRRHGFHRLFRATRSYPYQ